MSFGFGRDELQRGAPAMPARLSHVHIQFGLIVCLVLNLCLTSCSRKSASAGQETAASGSRAAVGNGASPIYTPPGAVYEVTYTPNTVRIDLQTTEKLLRSVSDDA